MTAPAAPTIRVATVADAARLVEAMRVFNREEGITWDPVAGRVALDGLLADDRIGVVHVADDADGVLAGYALCTFGFDLEFGGRDAYLTELWTAPARRGAGVGQALLAAVEGAAATRGAGALHLQVRPENAPAVSLYVTRGFEASHRVLMTKRLPRP